MPKNSKTIPESLVASVGSSVTANELRIGNFVCLPSKAVYAVDVLYKNYEMLKVWKPIEITEEWLFKLGFDKSIEMFDYFSRSKYYTYELKNMTYLRYSLSERVKNTTYDHIKYVHQLQNLYFALNGSELKLVE